MNRMILALTMASLVTSYQPAPSSATKTPPETKQFLVLIYETPAEAAKRTGDASGAYWGQWGQLSQSMTEAKASLAGGPLELTDGTLLPPSTQPEAKGKTSLTGFIVLNVPDMKEAVRWANQCPNVKAGGKCIIRPVLNMMAKPNAVQTVTVEGAKN